MLYGDCFSIAGIGAIKVWQTHLTSLCLTWNQKWKMTNAIYGHSIANWFFSFFELLILKSKYKLSILLHLSKSFGCDNYFQKKVSCYDGLNWITIWTSCLNFSSMGLIMKQIWSQNSKHYSLFFIKKSQVSLFSRHYSLWHRQGALKSLRSTNCLMNSDHLFELKTSKLSENRMCWRLCSLFCKKTS